MNTVVIWIVFWLGNRTERFSNQSCRRVLRSLVICAIVFLVKNDGLASGHQVTAKENDQPRFATKTFSWRSERCIIFFANIL